MTAAQMGAVMSSQFVEMRRQLEEKLQAPLSEPLPRKTQPMRALEPPQGRYVRDARGQETADQAQPSEPVDSRPTSQAFLSSWDCQNNSPRCHRTSR